MFVAAFLAILVSMGLALARALLGPTTYDRIAAVNMFGTKTVLLISVLAFFSGRTDLLDIALVYALINFIGVVAALGLYQRLAHTDCNHLLGEESARVPCGRRGGRGAVAGARGPRREGSIKYKVYGRGRRAVVSSARSAAPAGQDKG